MSEGHTVLVFGATGQQGGAVARALRQENWDVRAFVRDPESTEAQALATVGCAIAQGNLGDRASIEAALVNVYGVFCVLPSSGQGVHGINDAEEISYATQIAEAAQSASVRHFVYSSFAAAEGGFTGVGHFDSKITIEKHLASLSIPITVVRPTTFMEILVQPGFGLNERCLTFFAGPERIVQFIAAADIGRIVAAVFAEPNRFGGKSFEIAGDALTGDELVAKLSAAAHEKIGYQKFPDAVLAENETLRATAALFDDGRLAGRADIDELRKLVPGLLTLDRWLTGSGQQLLMKALRTPAVGIALR